MFHGEKTLAQKLLPVWMDLGGKLTADLVQQPSPFGIGNVPRRMAVDATTDMICGYCATGCSLKVHLQAGEAVNLSPSFHYPVNRGMACPKGWEALSALEATDRGTTPLMRDASGTLKPVSWSTALDEFVGRFKSIQQKYGQESIAFLSTGQIACEEMAFLGALAKFGMGMIHGDGNTRQCMATAVTAYKQSFGFDAPPYTYQDLEESDVLVFVGSNLCVAHPIMWQRVLANPHHPEIIVIDPRMTETAMAATEHVALKPKSDLVLLYGLANRLITHRWIEREFIDKNTEAFEAFAEHVQAYSPDFVSERTGVTTEQLERLAQKIQKGKRVSFWWTMGVNQSYEGTRTAQAIINLALMTGNIGRPGTGANSITGQCNAMGSRLFSNTTNLLGGHDFKNETHRRKVATILGIPYEAIPDRDSLPYHQIIESILKGKIRGLWVICTNPAHSWINQSVCREILKHLDFLVVQDMYPTTDTAKLADLYLPAAGWGEKDGTFINSERRIGLIKKVGKAPGQALADFHIFRAVAEAWGCSEMFHDWTSPKAVFEKLKQLTEGQPCEISGIRDYQMIDDRGGIQWPFTEKDALRPSEESDHRRLFQDGKFFTPNGRAIFHFESPRTMPESPTKRFPFTLLTGRGSAAQWHTQTRTSKSPILQKLGAENIFVEINPRDARGRDIKPNMEVIVESQRGKLRAKAFLSPTVQPGQVFIPMHYEETNRLTLSHFDPYSHQPSYKNCSVDVRLAEAWDVE
ncbi:MAG: nitrate reductase [Pirellulaceae bacterium]|nr:nitrate reductase [Pirellulaceae bacterium]